MLNKKELEETVFFLSLITEQARTILDEVATFEGILLDLKKEQKEQSELRKLRKKKMIARLKAKN